MNYELYMRAALSEAVQAARAGERADGAVAVLDEAMVAHGRESVRGSGRSHGARRHHRRPRGGHAAWAVGRWPA